MTLTEAITLFIGLSSVLAILWKGFRLIDHLENRIFSLEVTLNGVREKVEHNTTRFTGRLDRLEARASQYERFLAKTTDFEVRD